MHTLHLKIITPQKISLEDDVLSVSVPSVMGEITILPRHINIFTLLKEGIIKIKKPEEQYLAIGGGYLETDGEAINILVSRAHGQDEIDLEQTQNAITEAQKTLSQAKDTAQRQQAISILRRSFIDMKLIKRRKKQSSV